MSETPEEPQYRLYEDIKTLDEYSTALVPVEPPGGPQSPEVAALEQGTRYHPDGTVVDYRRVEYR